MKKKTVLTALLIALTLCSFAQNTSVVSGIVKTEEGEALPFANVIIKETNQGTATEANGNFTIKEVTTGNYTLVISATGYTTQEEKIIVKSGETCKVSCTCKTSALQLQDVTVTAEKREEKLQKVSIAVTSINAKQVEAYRLWSAKDLTGLAPNLTTINSGNETNIIAIRGISSFSLDPAVTTYVDGVNQFDVYSNMTYLTDIERIEVLRGPQGTLYGRNAMGGVINIITKQPNNGWKGNAEVSYGNYNQKRYTVGVGGTLIKDKLFVRANGFYNQRDGFFTNTFDNKKIDKPTNFGGDIKLKYLLTNKWTADVDAKVYKNTNTTSFPYAQNATVAFEKPYETTQNRVGYDKNTIVNTSLKLRYDGEKFKFKNVAAYQQNFRNIDNVDGDWSAMDIYSFSNLVNGQGTTNKTFTNEFIFSDAEEKKGKWKWQAGNYSFYQNAPSNITFNVLGDAALLGDPNAPYSQITQAENKNFGTAFFGQASYKIIPALQITAGLRYDYEHKELQSQTDYKKAPQPVTTIAPKETFKGTYNSLSPKVVFTWTIKEPLSLYASYSRGFRAADLNPYRGNNKNFIKYNPEYSDNYEIGIKSEPIKNKLRLNVAAFAINWKDVQVSSFTPDGGFQSATQNIAAATSFGAEAELNYIAAKGLQFDYTFGITEGKYNKLSLPDFTTGNEKSYDNNKLIYTPKHTSVAALQYMLPIRKVNFISRLQWNWIGKQYFDLENRTSQDAYHSLNARIGISTNHLDFFIWGQNITDN